MIKKEDFRKCHILNQDFVRKHVLRDEKNIIEISLLPKDYKKKKLNKRRCLDKKKLNQPII